MKKQESAEDLFKRLGIKVRKLDPNNPEDKLQIEINKANAYFHSKEYFFENRKNELKNKLLGKRPSFPSDVYLEFELYVKDKIDKMTMENEKDTKIMSWSEWIDFYYQHK